MGKGGENGTDLALLHALQLIGLAIASSSFARGGGMKRGTKCVFTWTCFSQSRTGTMRNVKTKSGLSAAALSLLALDVSLMECTAFIPSVAPNSLAALDLHQNKHQLTRRVVLSSSPSSDNSQQDDGRTNVDAMRSLLESSWNVGTMGEVPTSPESAAEAASQSITASLEAQPNKRLLQVDIRLPSFDIRQGPNIYDDIQSVEFCCQLAENLRRNSNGSIGKALILVRDGSAVRSAARILDVKERKRQDEESMLNEDTIDRADGVPVDEDGEEDSTDVESGGDDIDAFRKQLSLTWGDDDGKESSSEEPEIDPSEAAAAANRARRGREQLKPSVNFNPEATKDGRSYRLASWFADETISTGADMFTDAIEAVDTHGTMLTSEDVLILLSPVSREDTVAVRRLISRYGNTKTIVLVNSALNPEPKEAFLSIPAYSITPLIAKPMQSESNFMSQKENAQEESPTKIIVLRRFPDDWQCYIDIDGSGFELVDSAPANTVGKLGPANDWIAACVKRHMAFKFGQY